MKRKQIQTSNRCISKWLSWIHEWTRFFEASDVWSLCCGMEFCVLSLLYELKEELYVGFDFILKITLFLPVLSHSTHSIWSQLYSLFYTTNITAITVSYIFPLHAKMFYKGFANIAITLIAFNFCFRGTQNNYLSICGKHRMTGKG